MSIARKGPKVVCQKCGEIIPWRELYFYNDSKNGIKDAEWCGKCLLAHCEKYYPGSPNHYRLKSLHGEGER